MIRRWLIRALALSLLTLCVVAWVGSYWRETIVQYWGLGRLAVFGEGRGEIGLIKGSGRVAPPPRASLGWNWYTGEPEDIDFATVSHHLVGFGFELLPAPFASGWAVYIPLYFPTLLSALLLWLVWRKTRPKYNGRGFPVEAAGKEAAKP